MVDPSDADETEPGGVGIEHRADRPPTDDEAALADEHRAEESPERRARVAAHEEEMMEIGAEVKGEGSI